MSRVTLLLAVLVGALIGPAEGLDRLPAVLHLHPRFATALPHPDRHRSAGRAVLQGVVHQRVEQLPEQVRVDGRDRGTGRRVEPQVGRPRVTGPPPEPVFKRTLFHNFR